MLENVYESVISEMESRVRSSQDWNVLKEEEQEIEHLKDLHMISEETFLEWRNRLYTALCGS